MLEFCFFEIKYRFKHVSTYVLGFIMIAIVVLYNIARGGVFDRVKIIIITGGEQVALNSPYSIYSMSFLMLNISLFIMALFIVQMFSKDFETKFYGILFTKPIKKYQYIFGRLLGNLIMMTVLMVISMLTSDLSMYLPGMDKDLIIKTKLIWYLNPLFIAVIPNLIIISALFIAFIILTKRTASVFIVALVFLLFSQFGDLLMHKIDLHKLASLIDPFANKTFNLSTLGWTGAERNSMNPGLTFNMLINRVVWLLLSFFTLFLCIRKFNFEFFFKGKQRIIDDRGNVMSHSDTPLPVFTFVDVISTKFRQFLTCFSFNLSMIYKSSLFYWVSILGIGIMYLSMYFSGMVYGTKVLPVTYSLAGALSGGFTLFFLLLISFFTGEIVWASRDRQINLIEDSLPVSPSISFFAKFSAMAILIATYFLFMIMVGVTYQTVNEYYHYEFGVYFGIFSLKYFDYLLYLMLAFFIHNIINNKYASHFAFVIFYFSQQFFYVFGIEHNLLIPFAAPIVMYSDMASFGTNLVPALWFKSYWLLIMLILVGFTVMTYRTGAEQSFFKNYLKKIKTKPALIYNGVLFSAFFIIASWIFYNTNIRNEFRTSFSTEKLQKKYEITYGHLSKINQPKIQDIKLNVAIHPNLLTMTANGCYTMKNVGTTDIDTLLIHYKSDDKFYDKNIDSAAFQGQNIPILVEHSKDYGLLIYKFNEGFAPGDSLIYTFNFSDYSIGFGNYGRSTSIQENGTFFSSTIFPSIGYDEKMEISNEKRRKKFNLPEKNYLPETTDPWGLSRTLVSGDAHWISFEATVSTSADQIALAPGVLVEQWTQDDRNYFTYKIDKNANNFYAFLSARYEVMKDSWNGIDFEIYHHKDHTYNLENMMAGLIDAVEYYNEAFGDYPYPVLRIAEFPRYASYAQAFPTLIPFSEGIGFIADLRKDTIEYPYYVTAHETAHQWWAHQVISGLTRGSQMIVETFTQYSSLMVVKHSFSDRLFREQLRYSQNMYLIKRGVESRYELPLSQVEYQQYIFYDKGILTMNALSRLIGEDTLNEALKLFADQTRFTADPYPNSTDFLNILDAFVPDSLKTTVDDMFNKIVIYEHELKNAESIKQDDDTYLTTVEFTTEKRYYDEKSNPTITDYEGWLEIGLINQNDNIFQLEKVKITQKNNTVEIVSRLKPDVVTLDPYVLTLDFIPLNNSKTFLKGRFPSMIGAHGKH